MPVFGGFGGGPAAGLDSSYLQIGHCLFALLAALLGGLLSIYFFASPDDEASERAGPSRRRRASRPGAVGSCQRSSGWWP